MHKLRQIRTLGRVARRFCHERLASLVRTLELNDIDTYSSLQRITNLATLVGTYQKGASAAT
jgi:DNA excision repair protein ERCC-2